jgi:hypothetical protein
MTDEEIVRTLEEKYDIKSTERNKSGKLNGNYYQNGHGSK